MPPAVAPEVLELARRVNPARHSLIQFAALVNGGYVSSPFHTLVANALEQFVKKAESGQRQKLMIFCPPQRGKSTLSSQTMPAWYLGRNPQKRVILTSYAQSLANKFSLKTRDIVSSQVYSYAFPECRLRSDVKSVENWQTTERGEFRAAGAGAGITGMGAHILITDDPFKDAEEAESEVIREKRYDWYLSTARSRLAPGGSEVMVLTRWHMDDLAGRLLAQEPDWLVIKIPLFATDSPDPLGRAIGQHLPDGRYSQQEQEQLRDSLTQTPRGRYFFTSLYQQNPQPSESMPFPTIKRTGMRLTDLAAIPHSLYVIADFASTKDGDATAVIVGGVDAVNVRRVFIALEIQEAPRARNLRVLEIMRQVSVFGCGTLYVEAGADALESLRDAMREHDFYFGLVELKHRGRAKTDRIFEIDNKIHALEVGPDAEIAAHRLTQWSPVSGTPDDVPDALAYFCEVSVYNPQQVAKYERRPYPAGSAEAEIEAIHKRDIDATRGGVVTTAHASDVIRTA